MKVVVIRLDIWGQVDHLTSLQDPGVLEMHRFTVSVFTVIDSVKPCRTGRYTQIFTTLCGEI